ncbi:beta strand repeat-containing protein [Erwinia aphidicola]|uniref:beta strand repeat-containing protein n=1 Tax=Erwinia aphidicola TaxID=68334 RepID=UPI0030CF3937
MGQDGKWSLAIPSSALSGVTDGNLALNVVVSDAAGNSKTLAENVTAIINNVPVVPALTGLFGGDNLLNHAEALLGQTIGGTLNAVAGSTVTVTLGTKTYTTTVQAGGAWSVNIGATDLLSLATGNATLGVKVVDPAGNTASNSVTVGLLTAEPSITLNTIFGDGALNLNDVTNFASQLISGTVKNVAAGTIVNLNVGNIVSATATVNADGTFSTNLTQAQLQLLTGNPNLTVTASLQDAAGNTASASGGLAVNLTAPSLVLNQLQLFGDGVLNAADALLTQTISGTTTAGARVVVNVNSTQLVATADSDGKFSIALTPALLATLTDGNLNVGVSVTDAAGNTTSNSLSAIVGINNLPSVTLNPLFGDGVLSVAEALLGQTLSGHVNNVAAGTSVRINVGTTTLTATTDANGNFTAALAPSLLTTLLTGNLTVGVAVTDAYGNNASASVGVIIGVQSAPTIAVNTIFGDGVLSAGDLANAQLISGTSTNAVAGSTVTVVLGTHTYTTTVGSGGGWSLSVPKADLATLANGTQTAQVTLSDPYGNSATTSGTVSVIAQTAPTITIGTLFGDGGLNAVEALSAQTISGTATNAEGSTIAVKVGTLTLNAIVAANGSWSVSVPSASLLALADGTQTITASLVNGAGNTANGSASVIVGTHVTPTVTLTNASVFTDHYLNLAEAGAAQTLSGTATNAVGGTVAVNIAGTVYNTTVGSNGSWSVSVPSSGLSAIADGSHTVAVTVTDRAGNSASTSTSFTAVTHSLPAIGVDAVTSLVSVLLTGLTISGGTLRLATGNTVSITLSQNGQSQTQTAVIDANGRYSAKFTGGLLTTLNLGALVTVAAVDAAGNPATTSTTLLLGSLLPVSSTVAAASLMAVAADDSLAVASTDTSSTSSKTSTTTEESSSTAHAVAAVHSTLVTDSDTSSTDAATTSTSATTSTAAAATTPVEADSDAYTIGGVTITLADGQVLHGDSVTGSIGNDTISVGSMDFSHIDGGAGTDTLVLNGEHLTLDLTSLGLKVEHIEIIDLGKAGNNSIKLDLNEALNITDKQTDDLLIKGTLGDQVTLANGDGGIWATTGQRTVGGQTYDVYHNSALSSENTLGDVLIQHNLQVHVV